MQRVLLRRVDACGGNSHPACRYGVLQRYSRWRQATTRHWWQQYGPDTLCTQEARGRAAMEQEQELPRVVAPTWPRQVDLLRKVFERSRCYRPVE